MPFEFGIDLISILDFCKHGSAMKPLVYERLTEDVKEVEIDTTNSSVSIFMVFVSLSTP